MNSSINSILRFPGGLPTTSLSALNQASHRRHVISHTCFTKHTAKHWNAKAEFYFFLSQCCRHYETVVLKLCVIWGQPHIIIAILLQLFKTQCFNVLYQHFVCTHVPIQRQILYLRIQVNISNQSFFTNKERLKKRSLQHIECDIRHFYFAMNTELP